MIEKLNAMKRSKTTILRSVGLMTGLWDLKDIVNSRQNCSKNKLVGENAVADQMEVARSGLWAPGCLQATG